MHFNACTSNTNNRNADFFPTRTTNHVIVYRIYNKNILMIFGILRIRWYFDWLLNTQSKWLRTGSVTRARFSRNYVDGISGKTAFYLTKRHSRV